MDVFNSDAYGINELMEDMTEYFDTPNNEQVANLPAGPATPAAANAAQAPPPLVPTGNTRLTGPATNSRARSLRSTTQQARVTGTRATGNQHPGAGRKSMQPTNYTPRSLYSSTPTSTRASAESSPLTPESDAPKLSRALRLLGVAVAPDASAPRSTRSSSAPLDLQYDDDTSSEDNDEANVFEVHYIYSSTLASDPGKPRNFAAAMKSPERAKWETAMHQEIANFYQRGVWKQFPRAQLNGRKPLRNRWVFKKKHEQDKSTRYKGRIVVKGYVQIPGVDFTESFAPVATDTSICTVFAITLYKQVWVCELIDVEAAFLEADLDEDIYMEWPEGILEFGFENEATTTKNCILLEKAMYGTVQAARQWFKKLLACLVKVGLTQSKIDPCVFYLKRGTELVLVVATYVDDCAVAGKQADVNWLKLEMKKHFTIKELGPIKKHLGVWYTWGVDKLGRYLQSDMEDFVRGMINDFKELFGRLPKVSLLPALPGTTLTKNDGEILLHGEYRSIVGKILYYVRKISPICANACRELSQHLENPGTAHWKAVERLLGYLDNDKKNRIMRMRAPTEMRIMDVVDSAFANNPDTRKSTNAYLGTIGGHALVNWISKGQNIVTLSSTDSEFVSLSDGSKETIRFLRTYLMRVIMSKLPSIIAEDNTGAIFLYQNQQSRIQNKAHQRQAPLYIVRRWITETSKCSTLTHALNPADLLSKNVTQKIHDNHADHI